MIIRLWRSLLDVFSKAQPRETLAPLTQKEFEALRLECLATGTPC